ncbi:MAG: hypothetical protein J6X55_01930 [Victivallales bacterium]|nr:hypothetical protein [Victivallales bacterium]
MDLTIEHRNNEKEAKCRLKRVCYRAMAPYYVTMLCAVVMLVKCGLATYSVELRCVCFSLAVLGIVKILTGFPFFWRRTRKTLTKSGTFEHPMVIHLTDAYVEITCGENYSKNEYKVFSDYILLKDTIVLRIQRYLAGFYRRNDFPDGGAEFIRCLEACGVKRTAMWKRWWAAWLLLALAVYSVISFISTIHNEEWSQDKAERVVCMNNLKMTYLGLTMYANEANQGASPMPPSLQALKNAKVIEKNGAICPTTMQEYKFIPYSKMPDALSPDKAPIVIDGIPSHYKWPYFPIKWSRVWQTPILFADGHISLEEDVYCYMDIYDRYGYFLDETEAETLKKCCEAWDSGK